MGWKLSAALLCAVCAATAAQAQTRGPANAVLGLIVKPQSAGAEGKVSAEMAASLSTTAGRTLHVSRHLSGAATRLGFADWVPHAEAEAIAAALTARPDVRYAVPDYWRHPTAVPNDPLFPSQWYLQAASSVAGAANLPAAWDVVTGSDSVVVAVLDTGILPAHADLSRLLSGYDFVDATNLPINIENDPDPGRDPDPSDPGDAVFADECGTGSPALNSSWHGTRVTGIIGATTDNSTGIAGVDRRAQILPVRVLGKCGGVDSDITDAARWAAGLSVPGIPDNPNPARVINLSLGGIGPCSALYQDVIDEVIGRGVAVIVAAGNEGVFLDSIPVTPAVCDGAITVAATTRQGAETGYTNIGSAVDVAAPGGSDNTVAAGILSTSDSGTTVPLADSDYSPAIGTSFSTPIVSGVAALLLALDGSLTPLQIQLLLRNTARSFPSGTLDGFGDCNTQRCGAGIVDAAAAVTAVQNGAIPGVFPGGRKIEVLGDNSERRGGLAALGGIALALLALPALLAGMRRHFARD